MIDFYYLLGAGILCVVFLILAVVIPHLPEIYPYTSTDIFPNWVRAIRVLYICISEGCTAKLRFIRFFNVRGKVRLRWLTGSAPWMKVWGYSLSPGQEGSYFMKESWVEAEKRLRNWVIAYSNLNHEVLIPRKQGIRLLLDDKEDQRLVLRYLTEEKSSISFHITSTNVGVVFVRHDGLGSALEYPFVDLNNFNNISEAVQWLAQNRGFYKWDTFMSEVKKT